MLLAALVAWGIASGATDFAFSPIMGDLLAPGALVLAAGSLLALVLAALALRAPTGVGPQSGA